MVLVARLVLIGVLGVAGIAKLGDREGARRAVIGFGAPTVAATAIVWLLAAVELLTAFALVIEPVAGGWVAAVLLGCLAAVVAAVLATGRRPECHCFGRMSRGRVG